MLAELSSPCIPLAQGFARGVLKHPPTSLALAGGLKPTQTPHTSTITRGSEWLHLIYFVEQEEQAKG